MFYHYGLSAEQLSYSILRSPNALTVRDPLAFPVGRAPGFDPTHIASSGIAPYTGYVGTPNGAVIRDILRPAASIISASLSSSIYGGLGQCVYASIGYQYSPSYYFGPSPGITFAAIHVPTSSNASDVSQAGPQSRLSLTAGSTKNPILWIGTTSATFSTISLSLNIPYFIAVSGNTSAANCVVVNLLTGAIQSGSVTGSYTIPTPGANNFDAIGYNGNCYGYYAAVMYGPSYLSPAQLLAWAQSPWDFWYPPTIDDSIFALSVGIYTPPAPFAASPNALAVRDPLAFPVGRAPGFDPTHIAASQLVRLSGLPASATFVNILNGSPLGKGTAALAINSVVGPGVDFRSAYSGSTYINSFSDSITTFTIAAIVVPGTSSAELPIWSSTTAGTGARLELNLNSGVPSLYCQGGNAPSGLSALSLNVPYFIAVTGNLSSQKWIVTNLINGSTSTSSTTISLTAETSSTYEVGGQPSSAGGTFNGIICATMFSVQQISPAALLAWAQSPWDFWYPPNIDDTIFALVAGIASTTTIQPFYNYIPQFMMYLMS